jgi:hypothetical protein
MGSIPESVRSCLTQHHVVVMAEKSWVFDRAIDADQAIWSVIDQIFFKNNPRVQNLVFAVPCWVGQFQIDALFFEESYLRVVVIHGSDLSLLIRAVNQFMAMYPRVVAKVIPKHQDWDAHFFQKTINAAFHGHYQFNDAHFFKYEKAHHHTLPGQWQEISDQQMVTEVPGFLTVKNL